MTQGRIPVFRGPDRLRGIWLALAERHGVGGADRILSAVAAMGFVAGVAVAWGLR